MSSCEAQDELVSSNRLHSHQHDDLRAHHSSHKKNQNHRFAGCEFHVIIVGAISALSQRQKMQAARAADPVFKVIKTV